MQDVRSRRSAGAGERHRESAGRAPAGRRASSRSGAGALGRALSALRRHPRRVMLGLATLHLVLALLAFIPAPQPGGDNAVYLALARALLGGEYRDLYDPAAPIHAQFPPGWPLIVAAALKLGIRPWVGIKLVVVAFSALGVALTYAWIRRRRRPELALGVGLLVAISPGVLGLSHWELSDVPFWAMTMAALVCWERLPRGLRGDRGQGTGDSRRRRPYGRTALAAALTACAYLTRSAGLPLLVAAAVWLVLRRRWRQLALYAAVVLPPAVAWATWTRAQGGYVSLIRMADVYAPDRGTVDAVGMVQRVGENVEIYAVRFLPILLGGAESSLLTALSVCVWLLAIYGWGRRVIGRRFALSRLRRMGVAELWVPLYVAMLLVWNPEWAGERLLLPIYPALLMYAGDALARIGRRVAAPRRRLVPATGMAAVALLALPGIVEAARMGTFCTREYAAGDPVPCLEPRWRDFFAMAAYAGGTLPEGSAVLSRKPALFYATSGIPGRTYPLSREPADFFRAARQAGARYVLLDDLDQVATGYLTPILMRRPDAFCVVHSLGPEQATLMGIRPDAERIPDLRGDPGTSEMTIGFRPCGPEYVRPPAP